MTNEFSWGSKWLDGWFGRRDCFLPKKKSVTSTMFLPYRLVLHHIESCTILVPIDSSSRFRSQSCSHMGHMHLTWHLRPYPASCTSCHDQAANLGSLSFWPFGNGLVGNTRGVGAGFDYDNSKNQWELPPYLPVPHHKNECCSESCMCPAE